jgi:hypothetical protein
MVTVDDAEAPGLGLAVRLALAAGARLLLAAPAPAVLHAATARAVAFGMAAGQVSGRVVTGDALVQAARDADARLLVASRAAAGDPEALASRLARAAGVPVLLA